MIGGRSTRRFRSARPSNEIRSWAGSVEAEHGEQSCVDLPLLLDRHAPYPVAESADVDGAELFDENPRGDAGDVNFGSECQRPVSTQSGAQMFHQISDGAHLSSVCFVGLERGDFAGARLANTYVRGRGP